MTRALAVAALLAALPASAAGPTRPGHTERVEYHDPATPPSRGPATAPVTIEIFFVPGVAMPMQAIRLLQQLADRHPARVRLIYRVLKGSAALLTPSAALEAQAEGKFFEFIDEVARLRGIQLKKDELVELARRIGLDPQRVARATQVASYRDLLDAHQRRLDRLHIQASPSAIVFNARPTKLMLGNVSARDIEAEYTAAYQRALDKLDRGHAPDQLMRAFEDEVAAQVSPPPPLLSFHLNNDDDDAKVAPTPLASPPLALAGLPSYGAPGARLPVVVLCRPSETTCNAPVRGLEQLVRTYPDEVRVVWAPWFDVNKDGAAELAMLADAALCAEAIGSNQGELTTSPGWQWNHEVLSQLTSYARTDASGRRRGALDAAGLIDAVAAKLDLSAPALAACRARIAGTAVAWVTAAQRAGVPVGQAHAASGAIFVIGGRIYEQADPGSVTALVEAELAPGVLGSLPRWRR